MKISIKNFKSIGDITDYEIKPLTILSGNNSSGKSSFIQLLLLLKQTIAIDSGKYPFFINGNFYFVKDYIDIIKGKDKSKKLEISFLINKAEFDTYGKKTVKSIFDNFPDYSCRVRIQYDFRGEIFFIREFELIYLSSEKDNYVRFIQTYDDGKRVIVESNNEYFVKGIYDEIPPEYVAINYSSIFPTSYDVIRTVFIDNPQGDEPMQNRIMEKEFPNLGSIKSFLQTYFHEIYYIGPLRIEPKDAYPDSKEVDSVGTKGEYVAQILEKRQNEMLNTFLPKYEEGVVTFQSKKISLLKATNYWMCEIFKFGKKLSAKENSETYSILFLNNNNVETTIKHVGFGISQILPIIVQGLLLPANGILVLEQPEIHLHPKLQSILFDFLHSLIIQNKTIIIETHSDHFITRMRRRIAEDVTEQLRNKINLTFIEQGGNDIVFRTLDLNEFGSLSYFPEEFIERPDIELKALIKAQMGKRISKKMDK